MHSDLIASIDLLRIQDPSSKQLREKIESTDGYTLDLGEFKPKSRTVALKHAVTLGLAFYALEVMRDDRTYKGMASSAKPFR